MRKPFEINIPMIIPTPPHPQPVSQVLPCASYPPASPTIAAILSCLEALSILLKYSDDILLHSRQVAVGQ